MLRGEIYWALLEPRSGSEQRGRRPVVIVSRDALNQVAAWRSINVVPLSTSFRQARRGLTTLLLAAGVGGLAQDSVALCHQVTTLDRAKLADRIGQLPPEQMARLNEALRLALELD
ncbi:MAG: type II toxin-antitoxin system PemK/MazF family toxin [Candidatus Eremiobacterota bacterium]